MKKSESQKTMDKAEICKAVRNLRLEKNNIITIKEAEVRELKKQLTRDTDALINSECEKRGVSVKLINNILNT